MDPTEVAPRDPRADGRLPAPGTLPVVAEVDALVRRVIVGNPGPLTLDGTNTYLVGAQRDGEVLVVDPGPDAPDATVDAHLDRLAAIVTERSLEVVGVVATHHHADHAGALARAGARLAAPVVAAQGAATLGRGAATVEVVATPGHTRDHVALRTASGALLTGDHVLGRGTSVVAHPDGDLDEHVASLARVRALGCDLLLPGHGPAIDRDADAVLAFLLAHRAWRRARVLAALDAGARTIDELLVAVYGALEPALAAAAHVSLAATLVSLERAGEVATTPSDPSDASDTRVIARRGA